MAILEAAQNFSSNAVNPSQFCEEAFMKIKEPSAKNKCKRGGQDLLNFILTKILIATSLAIIRDNTS